LLVGAAGLSLVASLVFVFGYLPDRVEEAQLHEADSAPQIETAVADAPRRLSEEELAAFRDEAEDLRFQLLEQREELDARSAASWGNEIWANYETEVRAGDDALLANQLPEAVEYYQAALASGEALFGVSQEIMSQAQAAGEDAIAAGDPELARTQFELVLAVDPDDRAASRGLERATVLPDLLDAMRRGDQLRSQGDLEAAAEAYREVLALDGNWAAARTALDEVSVRLAESRFESLLSTGFAALGEGRFDSAIESFNAAAAMRPGSEAARDGLAQAEQQQLLNSIVIAEVRGMAFERRELWDEAMARYREALEVDPTLSFAIEGLERAQRRADLQAKIDALIDSPRLLLSDEVLQDANSVLVEARAIDNPGPAHTSRAERLAALIDLAATPIDVTLVSDNVTEVTIYRVGELGTFTSKQLSLKPGQYTAVGARRGFRDVRQPFTVLPGRDIGPVTVVCVEPI
jgi:tetratricopeptide (TPR) repeat protein